jgi:cytochrome b
LKEHAVPLPIHSATYRTRVWDLPTRIFHWALVLSVLGLFISVNIDQIQWHFRFGYAVLTLLMFRVVWGLIGGRWSRFAAFIYAPSSIIAYWQGRGKEEHSVGHNPMGAGSVFAMLLFLLLQIGSGLVSDDEIANQGPLYAFVSSDWVSRATFYHKEIGKLVLIALIVLHVAAIAYYWFKKRDNLLKPMLHGDKDLPLPMPASRDDAVSRSIAAVVLVLCALVVRSIVSLGG